MTLVIPVGFNDFSTTPNYGTYGLIVNVYYECLLSGYHYFYAYMSKKR